MSAPDMTWPARGWAAERAVAWLGFTFDLACGDVDIVLRCNGA